MGASDYGTSTGGAGFNSFVPRITKHRCPECESYREGAKTCAKGYANGKTTAACVFGRKKEA